MGRHLHRPITEPGCGLVVYRRRDEIDAIDEYSRRLVEALNDIGVAARYSPVGLSDGEVRAAAPPWLLLQYNPFSYGKWGFAPGVVRDAVRVRQRGSRLALFVHEAWVGMHDWRSTLMGAYQRAQLMSLVRAAHTSMVTTEFLAREVGHGVVQVPVASNITPVAVSREDARSHLGIADELVVTLFGTAHPSRDHAYAAAAIRALAQHHGPRNLVILNLGAGAPPPRISEIIKFRNPGYLPAHELSLHLLASDVLLLPFKDGVSTRRTTLMAGLAHGVPVVGLRNAHTDQILIDHPEALRLVPVGDQHAFISAAKELSQDREGLRAAGEAARVLYQHAFDWPIVAARVADAIFGDRRR